jgi:hypothetical protein
MNTCAEQRLELAKQLRRDQYREARDNRLACAARADRGGRRPMSGRLHRKLRRSLVRIGARIAAERKSTSHSPRRPGNLLPGPASAYGNANEIRLSSSIRRGVHAQARSESSSQRDAHACQVRSSPKVSMVE